MEKGKTAGWISVYIFIFIVIFPLSGLMAEEQQFYDLGDFKLESGRSIENCRLGYRTFGTLNKDKSNVVLFPTWFTGTTADLTGLIGPGKLVDTSRYFVIGVDAFGNGVSSSPSNSRTQKGKTFPEFSIGDMINAQYRLINEKLGISRLHAVIGVSMGGMQAFHFAAAHPQMLKKAIPITGSPRLTSNDILLYKTALAILDTNRRASGWDTATLTAAAGMNALVGGTPRRFIAENSPEDTDAFIEKAQKDFSAYDPHDLAWQIKAILKQDIYAKFAPGLKFAKDGYPSMLAVISRQDMMVNPAPAREFAEITGADLLMLDSECGHYIFQCEFSRISSAVREFLEK
ncbi:MAG: alpha/beta fold hydrolase [Syntrophorhabdaceae bacterium]